MLSRLALPFALSGFAGLIYEIAWARLLRLAFGATSEATATVLAAFMAGLALGSVLGGRLADRRHPGAALRLYAHLEVGVAALSLASTSLLARFPETYAGLERTLGGGRAARSLSAGCLLVPPTLLMGATLPLLARAAVALGEGRARAVGWLYAVNTGGAVLGALAAGFVLLPGVGVSRTVVAAALLNATAAVLVYRLGRRLAPAPDRPPPAAAASRPTAAAPSGAIRGLVLLSAAVSGGVALGLEVLWNRTLVLTVGSSTQAFALMLATFLGGIALGSALYARRAEHIASPARLAGLLQLAIAAASVLLLDLAAVLPLAYLRLWEGLHDSHLGLVLLRLVPGAALMLLPALLMGASLPALVAALGRGRGTDAVGSVVGQVYAANTAGAIAGSLLVGLALLPALGVAQATAAVAAAGLAGAAAALLAARRAGAPGTTPLLAATAAAALLLARVPGWDPRVMARGLSYLANRAVELQRSGQLRQANEAMRVVFYRDGAESSVLVYDAGEGTLRSFVVNGRHEATTSPNDMRNQYLLGHLPAVLHRGPIRDGLVIALGSGMTAGCLARHAERVTVVELEPQVAGAARSFAAWNHDVLADPRVRLVIDDGRHFLLTTAATYDVITVDPIHPSVAGLESLYSLEQYRLLRRRLAPGGVAAQWLPLYQVGPADARTIAATFLAAFPDAQVWVNGSDAILIGGAGETPRPEAEIRDQIARPEVASSLAAVRQGGLGTFLAGYAMGTADLRRWVEGARVSRDDRPVLEFSLPWQTYRDTVDLNLLEIFRFGYGWRPPPGVGLDRLSPGEREQIERSRSARALDVIAIALRRVKHEDTMQGLFEQALGLDPDDALARQGLGR